MTHVLPEFDIQEIAEHAAAVQAVEPQVSFPVQGPDELVHATLEQPLDAHEVPVRHVVSEQTVFVHPADSHNVK